MPKSIMRAVDMQPLVGLLTSDVVLTSTPVVVCPVDLPAGTYEIDTAMIADCGVLTMSRNISIALNASNVGAAIRMGLSRTHWKSSTSTTSMTTIQNVGGSFPLSASMGTAATRWRYEQAGGFVAQLPMRLSVTASIADETCTLRAGSFIRARLRLP